MELRHIRYFATVAELLSYRKAAEKLHISQPPLSVQIQDLEREIGVPLFKREKKRITLTEAGSCFQDHARGLLENVERAVEQTRLAAEGKSGLLRIRFISSAVTGVLQENVTRYKKIYPDVQIDLEQSTVEQILSDLKNGKIDAGFVRGPLGEMGSMESRIVTRESYYIALPRNHILARRKILHISDLSQEPLLIYPRNTASGSFDDIVSLFRKVGAVPKIVQEAPEQLTLAGLVASGLGYSIVPECMTKIKIPGVVHRPLAEGKGRTGIFLVVRRDATRLAANFFHTAKTI